MAGILDFLAPSGGGLFGLPNRLADAVNGTFGFDPRTIDYQGLGQTIKGLDQDPWNTIMNMAFPQTPASFNDRFAPATQSPLGAAPLPPPVNVPSMKVAEAPMAAPQDAALPPNATPTGPANRSLPPVMPQQTADFPRQGGSVLEDIAGVLNPALGAQFSAQRSQTNQANALYQALINRGYDPRQAYGIALAAQDKELAKVLIPQALGLNPPKNMEELITRRAGGYETPGAPHGASSGLAEYEQFLKTKARGEKAGGVEGDIQATQAMNLPSTISTAQEAMRLAESLRSHPGRNNAIFFHGKASNYLPDAAIPGNTDAFDANNRLSQLKSGAFAQAYASLRGGGQISNVEGAKMTEALNRMNRASSRAEFDSALNDFTGILRLGIDKAVQQAGGKAPYGFQGNQGSGVVNGVGWKVVR